MIKTKRRKPRKIKKRLAKNGILIYDLSTLPVRETIKGVYKTFIDKGVVLWASSKLDNLQGRDCNNAPQVVNNVRGFRLKDISNV